MTDLYPGFAAARQKVGDAEIFFRLAGKGPPLLLLHGYPQTHVTWHLVAPALAENFTLIIPDLPGYGQSQGPAPAPENYSKRHIGDILRQFMQSLGYDRFALAGHDRGGRIAYRMALDHPTIVTHLIILDIVTTLDTFEKTDWHFAHKIYHWYFLAQPSPLPEKLIEADPDFYIRWTMESWLGKGHRIAPAAMAAYCQSFHNPTVIAAACADYRAGFAIDCEIDRVDREKGKKITAPTLVLWGHDGTSTTAENTFRAAWTPWTTKLTDIGLACGHFIMEEKPHETIAAIKDFLRPA